MTAAPDLATSYAPESDPAVGRDLALYGLGATLVVAAAIGSGRYGWLLLHRSDNFLGDLEAGWQVVLGEVAIGGVIVGLGLLGGYLARRLGRSLVDRTPHARAVRFASVLPGILLGAVVQHPVNAVLTWASNHTHDAAIDRVADENFLAQAHQRELDARKAPLRLRVAQPAAPRALAARQLSPQVLGTGWYSLQTPATSLFPIAAARASGAHGVIQETRTTLATATRVSTGWHLDIYVDERSFLFPTASAAAQYAGDYRLDSSKPCRCELSGPPITLSAAATKVIDGVMLHTWFVLAEGRTVPNASFSLGRTMYVLYASGFDGKPVTTSEVSTLLHTAVVAAKDGH